MRSYTNAFLHVGYLVNLIREVCELHFYVAVPPMIWIQNQLVGAMEGQQISLECHSEAYPKSINYWTKDDGNIITQGN